MIFQIGIQAGILPFRLQFVLSHRMLIEQLTGEIGDGTHFLFIFRKRYSHHINAVAIFKGLLAADAPIVQVAPCVSARSIQQVQAQIKETGCKSVTGFMSVPDKLFFIGIIDTPLHFSCLNNLRTEIRLLYLMRLILCEDMMRIAIIHGMKIIVSHVIQVQSERHGGIDILHSCRNALPIFIRIISGSSRFQEFLPDIIRYLFCRHDMEYISDRKGWLMLKACSAAAIHVSAHIAGDGLSAPGSINRTCINGTHQITIWRG